MVKRDLFDSEGTKSCTKCSLLLFILYFQQYEFIVHHLLFPQHWLTNISWNALILFVISKFSFYMIDWQCLNFSATFSSYTHSTCKNIKHYFHSYFTMLYTVSSEIHFVDFFPGIWLFFSFCQEGNVAIAIIHAHSCLSLFYIM